MFGSFEPRELNNRQSYAGNEGCFGGCLLLPFMIVIAPFVVVFRVARGDYIP